MATKHFCDGCGVEIPPPEPASPSNTSTKPWLSLPCGGGVVLNISFTADGGNKRICVNCVYKTLETHLLERVMRAGGA